MKKMLFSAAALLCSFAALAQAPVAQPQHAASPTERPRDTKAKQHGSESDDNRNDGKASAPTNHGQPVQAFAQSTTLTGADKGAAVSALASAGRSATQGQRGEHTPRSARGGEHGHASANGGRHTAGGQASGSRHSH